MVIFKELKKYVIIKIIFFMILNRTNEEYYVKYEKNTYF